MPCVLLCYRRGSSLDLPTIVFCHIHSHHIRNGSGDRQCTLEQGELRKLSTLSICIGCKEGCNKHCCSMLEEKQTRGNTARWCRAASFSLSPIETPPEYRDQLRLSTTVTHFSSRQAVNGDRKTIAHFNSDGSQQSRMIATCADALACFALSLIFLAHQFIDGKQIAKQHLQHRQQ